MEIYLVIPTIRNLNFLKAWKNEFSKCHLIIVEDNKKKEVDDKNLKFKSVSHFSHSDIDKEFGGKSWIFSRKNAGIRSYGFYKAYKMGADVIITLDDDCYPIDKNFVNKHLENLSLLAPEKWINTYPNTKWMFTRGFPYDVRGKFPVAISHGLWSGALDLDAKTEIKLPKLLNEKKYPQITQFVPFEMFYPMCSMNLAFTKEIVPIMFFPMMGFDPTGKSWGYDRYDDIWAGLFSKKIMDHLGLSVVNGSPFINHRKASLSKHNQIKEYKGMNINEKLWEAVDAIRLTKKSPKDCYIELAEKIIFPPGLYFRRLKKAMIIWANLF